MPTTNNGDRQRAVLHLAEAMACLRQLAKGLTQTVSDPPTDDETERIELVNSIAGNCRSLQAELLEKLPGRLPEFTGDLNA